jgi:hypothetical protein
MDGSWEAGRLESWEAGRPGDREAGKPEGLKAVKPGGAEGRDVDKLKTMQARRKAGLSDCSQHQANEDSGDAGDFRQIARLFEQCHAGQCTERNAELTEGGDIADVRHVIHR